MSELTPKVRELLLQLCEELLPEEDIVALARGGSKKGRITRIASQAGVATYGQPIGTVITADMRDAAKSGQMPKPGAGLGGAPRVGVPGAVGKPGGLAAPTRPSGPKDPADQFNADKTKLQATVTHPRVPGAKAYVFSDGTAVMEDSRGNRSKRQTLDTNALKAKGWNVQEHADVQEANSSSVEGTGNGGRRTGGPKSNFEMGEDTLKILAASTPKATPEHADALMAFEVDGASINSAMRSKGEPGEQNLKTIDGLRDLLGKSKTISPITVHKSMSFPSTEERDTFIQTSLRPGTAFVDKGFSVASANQDNAMLHADAGNADNPGIVMNVAVPEGSRAASINAATGKDFQDQDVLLPDGARFKINSVKYDAGGRPIVDSVYVDPLLPAHLRAKAEEDPTVTPQQKAAYRDTRFAWSANEIELEDLPLPQEAASAPGAPGAVATGRIGGTVKGINAKAAAKSPGGGAAAAPKSPPANAGISAPSPVSSPTPAVPSPAAAPVEETFTQKMARKREEREAQFQKDKAAREAKVAPAKASGPAKRQQHPTTIEEAKQQEAAFKPELKEKQHEPTPDSEGKLEQRTDFLNPDGTVAVYAVQSVDPEEGGGVNLMTPSVEDEWGQKEKDKFVGSHASMEEARAEAQKLVFGSGELHSFELSDGTKYANSVSLTGAEEDARMEYGNDTGADLMNGYLRKGESPGGKLGQQIADLQGAIDRSTFVTDTPGKGAEVYRGTAGAGAFENLKVGDVVEDEGFVSTSADLNKASKFLGGKGTGTLTTIRLPAGHPALVFPSGAGAMNEREILLSGKSTKFRVVEMGPNGPILEALARQAGVEDISQIDKVK